MENDRVPVPVKQLRGLLPIAPMIGFSKAEATGSKGYKSIQQQELVDPPLCWNSKGISKVLDV